MTKIRNPEDVQDHPNSKWNPEFPNQLVLKMAEGSFDYEVYADWDISKDCFYRWLKEYPQLKEAYDRGWVKCLKWWTTEGKARFAQKDDRGFKYWISIMNNKFGWGKEDAAKAVTNNTQINISSINVLDGKSDKELLELFYEKAAAASAANLIPKLSIEAKVIPEDTNDRDDSD